MYLKNAIDTTFFIPSTTNSVGYINQLHIQQGKILNLDEIRVIFELSFFDFLSVAVLLHQICPSVARHQPQLLVVGRPFCPVYGYL